MLWSVLWFLVDRTLNKKCDEIPLQGAINYLYSEAPICVGNSFFITNKKKLIFKDSILKIPHLYAVESGHRSSVLCIDGAPRVYVSWDMKAETG